MFRTFTDCLITANSGFSVLLWCINYIVWRFKPGLIHAQLYSSTCTPSFLPYLGTLSRCNDSVTVNLFLHPTTLRAFIRSIVTLLLGCSADAEIIKSKPGTGLEGLESVQLSCITMRRLIIHSLVCWEFILRSRQRPPAKANVSGAGAEWKPRLDAATEVKVMNWKKAAVD